MKRRATIVVGLGFGDEGKGLTVDWLCREEPGLVIRFNGGCQAGHTVAITGGTRHVCSSFGAGTLRGLPTYWTAYSPVSPQPLRRELEALRAAGCTPTLLLDPLCPVITPYDVWNNRILEKERGARRHGSCGMGFGAALAREETTPHRFYAMDLFTPFVARQRLRAIASYYRGQESAGSIADAAWEADLEADFLEELEQLRSLRAEGILELVPAPALLDRLPNCPHLIFEGAQGILLDREHGFFPHVTRSHTTARNAIEWLQRYGRGEIGGVEEILVSRAYHTRHGAGPLPGEAIPLDLRGTGEETNTDNPWQGPFRVAPLDEGLIRYAVQVDGTLSGLTRRRLMITCLDQTPHGRIPLRTDGVVQPVSPLDLAQRLDFTPDRLLLSHGPHAENVEMIG